MLALRDDHPPLRHRLARELALELSGIAGLGCAAVMVANPITRAEAGRATVGPCAPLPPGALLDLVLPTEPSVCSVKRTHDRVLRALAETWAVDEVLLAPCTFGHDLLAVAVAPLGDVPDRRAALRSAGEVAERTAAAMVYAMLLGEQALAAVS